MVLPPPLAPLVSPCVLTSKMDKTMKKIFAYAVSAVTVLVVAASCSNKAFDDKYLDPSKTTATTCDKMMTGTFIAGNQNTFNTYWRMYTWDNYFGKLAQTIGFSNNSGEMYYINDGYIKDRWNNFYDILRNFRILQNVYSESQFPEYDKLFVDCAEIFVIDHLSQLVDIWGPVPYNEAGYLGITGDLSSSYPSYDSDETLYKKMIERLDDIYTDLEGLKTSLPGGYLSTLQAQDFINGGDIDKWLRYCNTLMLRLAVHVSAQGSLASSAKTYVAKAAGRLLVSDLDNTIEVKSDRDGFKYNENFRDGFKDINNTANQEMIDAMQITGVDDPRLPVIYVPTQKAYTPAAGADPDDKAYAAGEYFGRSTLETTNEQNVRSGGNHNTEETRYYARLNGKTFTYNNLMVSPIISAAEAWFLLAEAYKQGYASGNAEAAFKKGVEMSIKAYYKSNINSDFSNPSIASTQANDFQAEEYPSDATISNYAQAVWDTYTDKLECIMTQKWLHFGIMQATQAWTDIRRTGFPALYYPQDRAGSDNMTIVQRVPYPTEEVNNNPDKNKEGAAMLSDGDNPYSVLFWAKKLQ